jgi:DNA polymerase-1
MKAMGHARDSQSNGEVTGVALPGFLRDLSPAWRERLSGALQKRKEMHPAPLLLPLAPTAQANRIAFVQSAEGAGDLLELAQQRPLSWIGFDTEFSFSRPPVVIRRKAYHDPSSIRPLLLSLALAESADGKTTLHRFVVDLRAADVLGSLRQLLGLPVCFVGHAMHQDLLCLARLGLPEPQRVWDTLISEKALHLGLFHKNYQGKRITDDADEAAAAEAAQQAEELNNRLPTVCLRYSVRYPFVNDKQRLQESFVAHPREAPFTGEQIDYAAADAAAVAELYPHQVLAATGSGILQHLVRIEMSWAITTARMTGCGLLKDAELCRRAEQAARMHLESLQQRLAAVGIAKDSYKQLKDFFTREGLLHLFLRGKKVTFAKEVLEEVEDHHQAIRLLRSLRKVGSLLNSRILGEDFVGLDGRVHPSYTQLGAQTGRQCSRAPNIFGLGKVFRPLIIAPPGRGIGEVDLSQIEPGIAGAVYGDERLVEMYNTGDVYSAMAMEFYKDQLTPDDRALDTRAFKKKHRGSRARMKICILALIYGITVHGLMVRLCCRRAEAEALLERFKAMFPQLTQGLLETPMRGALRGYVTTSSGLRRNRAGNRGPLTNWERNWMTNHPVQGSAAAVFKDAVNRLDRLYRGHDARMLVALHDSCVFEAPLGVLEVVADLTGRVLCDVVQEHFPCLRPQVEVNIQQPHCWNKDGRYDSVERWIQDPLFKL